MSRKWTTSDIPDQHGRTAVVTGANTGLGFDTAKALADKGAHVVLAVRDVAKGRDAVERLTRGRSDVSVEVVQIDLASLRSVRDGAAALTRSHPRIDLLINSAGLMYPPKQTTEDGFELQFGTNHLGHFALTGLLLDSLAAAPDSRVVTVSSGAHKVRAAIHFDDLQWERGYSRIGAYGQSKLANLMFTYELDRRFAAAGAPTIAVAAHPGVAATELGRHFPRLLTGFLVDRLAQTPAMGALPSLRAATDPTVAAGTFYGPDGLGGMKGHPTVVESSEQSHDTDLQGRLWEVSEKLTGVTYPI